MASGFGKGVRVGPEVLQPLISTTPYQVRLAHIAADLPWEHNSCCSPHLPPSHPRHRQRHSGICSQMLLLTECALTGAGLISLAPVTDTSMSSQGAVKKTGLKPISLQPVPAACVDKTFDNTVERSFQCCVCFTSFALLPVTVAVLPFRAEQCSLYWGWRVRTPHLEGPFQASRLQDLNISTFMKRKKKCIWI